MSHTHTPLYPHLGVPVVMPVVVLTVVPVVVTVGARGDARGDLSLHYYLLSSLAASTLAAN